MNTPRLATTLGLLPILLWSFSSWLYSELIDIPIFEIVAITFTLSFLLTAIKISFTRNWYIIKQPPTVWFLGVLGIVIYNMSYVVATKLAPIEQIMLISDTTPIFIVILATFYLKERLPKRVLLASVLGFLGVACVLYSKNELLLQKQAFMGYGLALSAAASLAIYTLSLERYKAPTELVGCYCGIGGLMAGGLHYHYESFVMPDGSQWIVLLVIGVLIQTIANQLWVVGNKFGNKFILSIGLYFVPVLASCWLVLSHKSDLTIYLLLAVGFVFIASILSFRPSENN